jgi:transposase, IS5 family
MQKSLFSTEVPSHSEWYCFKNSRWGRLYDTIPWDELESCLPAICRGPTPYFGRKGKFALMLLKHELGVSDEALIEHVNTNPCLQRFCHMHLAPGQRIGDTGIVSRVRGYLAHQADLDQVQAILAGHWQAEMNFKQVLKVDAVCYESYIRYPTDVKLLWECCEWVYKKQLFTLRKQLKVPLGKGKERFDLQHRKYLSYAKLKHKAYKKKHRRIKSLLNLLTRGLAALQVLLNTGQLVGQLDQPFYQYLRTIKQVLQQQRYLYQHPGNRVPDRIVSLHKPYIRPIKRGKENKPTEFGAKVHMMQTDSLCWLEHFSFRAFNECKRFKISVIKHKAMFGKCSQASADRIYATNENRRFCARHNIFHNFDPKGPRPKDQKWAKEQRQLKESLNKDRATRLEGSFGNHKNHYGLSKVKARNEANERVWIYFGVFTANAVQVNNQRQKQKKQITHPVGQVA